MSRFYFERRWIFQENSPELARAAIELALNPETDERVRSVLIVASLDRAGVEPMDYDPAQDQVKPTWDPGVLSEEERDQLEAILRKMIGKPSTVRAACSRSDKGHGHGTSERGISNHRRHWAAVWSRRNGSSAIARTSCRSASSHRAKLGYRQQGDTCRWQ
jgi:hypothetical protein